jgi:hypothetical protein
MPGLSTIGVVYLPVKIGLTIVKRIDQGWTEFFGAQQGFNYFLNFSKINQTFQFNNLKIYLVLFVFWVVFLFLLRI